MSFPKFEAQIICLLLQEYNHCQIHHKWKCIKLRKYPKPGLPTFSSGPKDNSKETETKLIGPPPPPRERDLAPLMSCTQNYLLSARVCHALATWLSISRATFSGWQKLCWCDYENSDIEDYRLKTTALLRLSSPSLWTLRSICQASSPTC